VLPEKLRCSKWFGWCALQARMLELTEEEVKLRAEAAQQQHMAANELLTQVHTWVVTHRAGGPAALQTVLWHSGLWRSACV